MKSWRPSSTVPELRQTEISGICARRRYVRRRGGGIIGLGPQVKLIIHEIAKRRNEQTIDAPVNAAALRGVAIPVPREEDVHIPITIARQYSVVV